MPLGSHFQLAGLLICCLLQGNTALAQTPGPTAIKYPDATASPATKAAFVQALEKCQTEVREDYASKMAKAVADGKPHLVPVYERRRDGHLISLCQLTAENAAGKALGAAYYETKRVADKITSGKETPKDIADLQVAYQHLKAVKTVKIVNAEKPELGIKQVLDLIEPVLGKYKRLQSLK